MRCRTVLLSAFVFAAMLGGAAPLRAQPDTAREAAIKAAFIYNFAKFTEWRGVRFGGEEAPVVFCVGAGSPLQPSIEALRGKFVRSHPIAVISIAAGSPVSPCHVLFVDDALPEALRRRLETHSIAGVLTVSDLPDFARRGGDIGLYYENNSLRFEINIRTAGESGITFSSKLLQLAVVIGRQSSRSPATVFAFFSRPYTGRHVIGRLRA